jgi:hypothetical protein
VGRELLGTVRENGTEGKEREESGGGAKVIW